MKPYTKYWKSLDHKSITATDIIIHCALKAWFAKPRNDVTKKDIFIGQIRQAFSPITNKNKLNNGSRPFEGIWYNFPFWLSVNACKKHNTGIWENTTFETTVSEIFSGEQEFRDFLEFLFDFRNDKPSDESLTRRHYCYIFVDQNNVEPIYQAVQAAHVAMVIGQNMEKKYDAKNVYFQICAAPKEYSLLQLHFDLAVVKGIPMETFYEPDVNRVIAIGTHPIPSHKRGRLREFSLLTF